MSSEPEAQIIGLGASEPPHAEFQQVQVAAHPATSIRPGASLRFVAEPCEKHAKNPPGEQSWNDDAIYATDADGAIVPNPETGAPIELQPASKKRDPNGFVHGCRDCESASHVVKEV